MNKIKIFKYINLTVFILSFSFVYFSFLGTSLSSFEIGEKIWEGFIFNYSLIFILIYIITKISIRKNEDKRKLYFHIIFFISVLLVWIFNINNIINYWKNIDKLKEINNYLDEDNYEKYEEELNNLSIENDKFLDDFIQEKKLIDWKYNSDIDTFFAYYASELTIENIEPARQATNNTLKSLKKSYNFYINIENKVKELKNKYNYPDDKIQKFLKWFYESHSPELYKEYIDIHRKLAKSFLDIINYTEKGLQNNIDLFSDDEYIKMLNDIQKLWENFNNAVNNIQSFNK